VTGQCAGEPHRYDRFLGNMGGVRSCGVWHRISPLTCRLAVTSRRFDGPANFRQPLAVNDHTRVSGAVFCESGELIKQANRPAGELQRPHRSPHDHPVCSSATGQSSDAEAAP